MENEKTKTGFVFSTFQNPELGVVMDNEKTKTGFVLITQKNDLAIIQIYILGIKSIFIDFTGSTRNCCNSSRKSCA